ncbi:hypothetical protein AABB24_008917, partial [Solanum stoloniferum]
FQIIPKTNDPDPYFSSSRTAASAANQKRHPETQKFHCGRPADPCARLTREHATASSQKPQRRLHGNRQKAKSQHLLPQAGTILYSFSAISAAASSLGLWDGATLRPRTGESIRSVDLPFPLSELGEIAKKRCLLRMVKVLEFKFRNGPLPIRVFSASSLPNSKP